MPLSEEGRLVGWIMVGQFRTGGQLPARVSRAAWARPHHAELARAFAAVPRIARRRDLLDLFPALVAVITAQRLVVARRDPVIERLLKAGTRGTVSLRLASHLVGIGRSRLAECPRAALGCGLRQAQIQARLERAAQAMRSGSAQSVVAAARLARFSDPAYFSRVWRRNCGSPPSQLLRAARVHPSRR